MGKVLLLGVLLILIAGIMLFVHSMNSFAINEKPINETYLEDLREAAGVECLQNSQCPENQECIHNSCVDKTSIDVCQETSLSTSAVQLKEGTALNSAKRVLSESDLYYLLTDEKLVEVIDNKTIEYLYSPMILLGNNRIEKSQNYFIEGGSLFLFRLAFSRDIDFSNKNIQGQALRILGKEYIIGTDSTNSNIYLVSDDTEIVLEDGKIVKTETGEKAGTLVHIVKGKDGNIAAIEILFDVNSNIKDNKESINVNENFIEPVFNSVKLSFSSADSDFADIKIGGF